ncbi:MAG: beta-L-arabinofuranosidase domain-containing protein, partial [Parabacteroides sp.]
CIAKVKRGQRFRTFCSTCTHHKKELYLGIFCSPRFSYLIWSHELYNFGHLYESAVAHYQATHQTNLLNIATKNADLLVRTFLKGDSLNYWVDGHPEVETGLIKLWKVTHNADYLQLAGKLLDLRGEAQLHELYLGYDEGRNPYFFQDYVNL